MRRPGAHSRRHVRRSASMLGIGGLAKAAVCRYDNVSIQVARSAGWPVVGRNASCRVPYGQRGIVTGAASGIGKAAALRMVRRRRLGARRRSRRRPVSPRSPMPGCETMTADLADLADRDRVAERGADADLLVNAAGIILLTPITEVTVEEWRQVADHQRRGDLLPLPEDRPADATRRGHRQSSRRARPSSPRPSRSRPTPPRRRRSCRSPARSPMRLPRGRCGSTRSAPASSTRRCRRRCSTGSPDMRGTTPAELSARTEPDRAARPRRLARGMRRADLVPAVEGVRLHDRAGDQLHRRHGDVVSRKEEIMKKPMSVCVTGLGHPEGSTSSTTAASSTPTPIRARSAYYDPKTGKAGHLRLRRRWPECRACSAPTAAVYPTQTPNVGAWVAPEHRPASIQKTHPNGKVEILVTERRRQAVPRTERPYLRPRRTAVVHRFR